MTYTDTETEFANKIGRLEGQNIGQQADLLELRTDVKKITSSLTKVNNQLSSITHDASVSNSRIEDMATDIKEISKVLNGMKVDEEARKVSYKIGAGVASVLVTIGTGMLSIVAFWPQVKALLRSLFI